MVDLADGLRHVEGRLHKLEGGVLEISTPNKPIFKCNGIIALIL